MAIKVFFRKTRDVIVETATIVRGLKEDFKSHEDSEDEKVSALHSFVDEKIISLHELIKDCHENCPETSRFNDHTKAQNGTLLRIEKRQDDHLSKLKNIGEEVKSMREAKKTTRQVWADIGKTVAYACIIGGLMFGALRHYDDKKTAENKKIEIMLEKLIDNSSTR